MEAVRWRDAENWARERIRAAGMTIRGIGERHEHPWSLVLGFDTDGGRYWLKANAANLAREVPITQAISAAVPRRVLPPLAADAERGWLLLEDAGRCLAQSVDYVDWIRVLQDYASFQRSQETLVCPALPDRAAHRLPELFDDLLEDRAALRVGDPGGLDSGDYLRLRGLGPQIRRLCHELDLLPFRDTVQHDDLWEGNIFLDGSEVRYIDWSDAVRALPFGSLVYPLRSVREHLGVVAHGPAETRLVDAYTEAWSEVSDRETRQRAVRLSMAVEPIVRALCWRDTVAGFTDEASAYELNGAARWAAQLIVTVDEATRGADLDA